MTLHKAAAPFIAARDFLLAHRTDYRAAMAGFSWPQLEYFNWALDYFDDMARGNDAVALRIINEDSAESLSFAALAARSNQVANFLRHLGVKRGDRMLLMLGNERALWEAMLAAMKLGAVIVPTTTLLAEADLQDRVERGQVRHVIANAEAALRLGFLPNHVTRIIIGTAPGWISFADSHQHDGDFTADAATRATDPYLLYFTSGTTAKPKLVLHSHQSYPVGHLSTMYWIGLQPHDVHLNISAPGWAKHAWSSFFAPWNAGATILVHNQKRFSAQKLLDTLVAERVTTFCAPPTVWRLMIQEDLTAWRVHLREVVGAGEPLNPEVIREVEAAWGLTIRDGYGQTETTLQIGNTPGQTVKPGSMGRAMPGYHIALVDEADETVIEGQVAIDLAARPTGLMDGYQQPDGSILKVSGAFYKTGDVARRDADDYLYYVGRADDVFKASDYRISPFELESALIEHEAVVEAAVVPSPDPTRLAVPKAFIILAEGFAPDRATALSIFRHVRARLSSFRRVRRIQFAELPKTISGKIRRVELRARERDARALDQRQQGEYWEEDFPELAAHPEPAPEAEAHQDRAKAGEGKP
ncbi:MAG: AMP-dependent synthetase [Rhodospirillales bacterium 20-60-12]|nr:MAG: AMP-dependent synthetase [Rhodospirillales bacterium 20-60-12]HQT68213.1 AMP-binding protein [Acetobacteraceae bacterium]